VWETPTDRRSHGILNRLISRGRKHLCPVCRVGAVFPAGRQTAPIVVSMYRLRARGDRSCCHSDERFASAVADKSTSDDGLIDSLTYLVGWRHRMLDGSI